MIKKIDADVAILIRTRNAVATSGMSIRMLSNRSGVPYRSLQNYLLGKHNMPAPVLEQVAEALDVSADWLVSGKAARFDESIFIELMGLIEQLLIGTERKLSHQDIVAVLLDEYSRRYSRKYMPNDEDWLKHMRDVGDDPDGSPGSD